MQAVVCTNLIMKPTCYQNLESVTKPFSIDLSLLNSLSSFQRSCVIEIGVSHFHKMIVTIKHTTADDFLRL